MKTLGLTLLFKLYMYVSSKKAVREEYMYKRS